MDTGAVGQLFGAGSDDLFQDCLGLVEFMFLHDLESTVIILHSLCKTWVLREGRARRRYRWWLAANGFGASNMLNFLNLELECLTLAATFFFMPLCPYGEHAEVRQTKAVENLK